MSEAAARSGASWLGSGLGLGLAARSTEQPPSSPLEHRSSTPTVGRGFWLRLGLGSGSGLGFGFGFGLGHGCVLEVDALRLRPQPGDHRMEPQRPRPAAAVPRSTGVRVPRTGVRAIGGVSGGGSGGGGGGSGGGGGGGDGAPVGGVAQHADGGAAHAGLVPSRDELAEAALVARRPLGLGLGLGLGSKS